MKPGTPGFVGARLREAREARGLSASALAEILEVSRQAVSQYENDQQTPRPEIMRKIEDTLKLPPHFFWRPVGQPKARRFFWRSNIAATKTERDRAARRYEWLEDIVLYLSRFVEFPRVNVPNFGECFGGEMPRHPNNINWDDIEMLAMKTRQFWKLGEGSISNVVWLLENNGAIVTRGELYAEHLDAFSEWSEWQESHERPFVFLGADKNTGPRSRFDAAHELGHIILHRNIDRAFLTRPAEFKLIEDQAHRFAGAFLLPSSAFANDFSVASLDAFRALKTKWNTSIAMMIYRSIDLNLVSKENAQRLWANRTRRGWSVKEPLDDELPIEKPRLLRRSFEMLVNGGVQTRDEILSALPYPIKDIEELACLPTSFLEEKQAPISLKDFSGGRMSRNNEETTGPAEIVDFKTSKDSKRA